MKVGVLALQGAFAAHCRMFAEVGAVPTLVRTPADLDGIDAIALPGGESTTMSKLLVSSGLFDPLRSRITEGLPVWGTCAGLILLARSVEPPGSDVRSFSVLDIAVRRNGYGRQIDSFEQSIELADDDTPFPAVFIRAPIVDAAGPTVEVLATVGDHPVLLRRGAVLAATFHPELTADVRLHERFVRLAQSTPARAADRTRPSA